MKLNRWIALLLVVVLSFTLGACASEDSNSVAPSAEQQESAPAKPEEPSEAETVMEFDENPIVVIETDCGTMEVELYPEIAPITVTNFVKLTEAGFYDGLTFHRVIGGFMIQGGASIGKAPNTIKGEFAANGVENNLKHTRGVISMARTMASYDSASSQFFIMHADYPSLDGQYASFGKVIKGIEVVDAIVENSPVVDDNGTVPAEEQIVITRIYLK